VSRRWLPSRLLRVQTATPKHKKGTKDQIFHHSPSIPPETPSQANALLVVHHERAANNGDLTFLVNVSDTIRHEVDRERPS
jgi:hypothetical protein